MKRRALLLTTAASSVSAAIFTATGWLMGTKALSMEQFHLTSSPYWNCCLHGWVDISGDGYNGCYQKPAGSCPPNYGNCFASCHDYWCTDMSHFEAGDLIAVEPESRPLSARLAVVDERR